MSADKHEAPPSAPNAKVAKSRQELAMLASRLTLLAQTLAHAGNEDSKWSAIQHRIGEAGSRGRLAAKGLAEQVERHPLIGGVAAFGLGFGLATLLFKRAKDHGSA